MEAGRPSFRPELINSSGQKLDFSVGSETWDDGSTTNGDESRGSDGKSSDKLKYSIFKAKVYSYFYYK